ncbi:MAG: hypothetical protein ACHBN1_08175 [Heteroscytonema crispum UTEX LB 1556]
MRSRERKTLLSVVVNQTPRVSIVPIDLSNIDLSNNAIALGPTEIVREFAINSDASEG